MAASFLHELCFRMIIVGLVFFNIIVSYDYHMFIIITVLTKWVLDHKSGHQ